MIDKHSSYFDAFNRAYELAQHAAHLEEIPVGAVVVERESGRVISEAHNEVEALHDPTAHAEILAIQRACKVRQSNKLVACDLIVTLEPCAMCAAAISHARINTLVFGAYDPKSGGVEHGAKVFAHASCHHKPEVISGIRESECAQLLSDFFSGKR